MLQPKKKSAVFALKESNLVEKDNANTNLRYVKKQADMALQEKKNTTADRKELYSTLRVKSPRSASYSGSKKPNNATFSKETRSNEELDRVQKAVTKAKGDSKNLARPLIYLNSPDKIIGDVAGAIKPDNKLGFETSKKDREELAYNSANPYKSNSEKLDFSLKKGLEMVPAAALNMALAGEGTGAVGALKTMNNSLNPLAGSGRSLLEAKQIVKRYVRGTMTNPALVHGAKQIGERAVKGEAKNVLKEQVVSDVDAEMFGIKNKFPKSFSIKSKPNVNSGIATHDFEAMTTENNFQGVLEKKQGFVSKINDKFKLSEKVESLKNARLGYREYKFDDRPFFEKVPVTGKQKKAVEKSQQEAHQRGVAFTRDWHYGPDGNMRPEVLEKTLNLDPYRHFDKNRPNNFLSKNTALDNPLVTDKNILVGSTTKEIKNSQLSDYAKKNIIKKKSGLQGVNMMSGESITFKGRGLYKFSPQSVEDTAAHELQHSTQNWTPGKGHPAFKDNLTTFDSGVADYYYANPDSEIGRDFAKHMVPSNGSSPWHASPDELHAELMVARKNITNAYVKDGHNREEIIKLLQNPTDEQLQYMIDNNNLNDFFKKETSSKDKFRLLRMLPTFTGLSVGLTAINKINKNNSKQ